MVTAYDLYDLHIIFAMIRFAPEYGLNNEIMIKVINVLERKHDSIAGGNQFRKILRSIPELNKETFKFAFVDNLYVYYPLPSMTLRNEYIYEVLTESCKSLLAAIEEKNIDKTRALAECLHNLPTDIVENKHTIPKTFWKREVKYYRDMWDRDFLKINEKHKFKQRSGKKHL
jgi:hypothetical protein